MRFYVGPWVWDTFDTAFSFGYWRPPRGCMGCIDLRPTEEMLQPSRGQKRAGLFALPDTARLPLDYRFLAAADTPGSAGVTTADRRAWERIVGSGRPEGDTVLDLLWWQMTRGADPSGDSGPKPLLPAGRGRKLQMRLARHVNNRNVDPGTPEWARIADLQRRDYQRLYEANPAHARKWLGYQQKKHQLSLEQLKEYQPAELRGELPLPPSTTLTDDFNTSDSDSLGNDLSWTEDSGGDTWDNVSNQAKHVNTGGGADDRAARADSDLSGSDVYAQADIITLDNNNQATNAAQAGVTARHSTSAIGTYYVFFLQDFGVSSVSDSEALFKVVSHSFTELDQDTVTHSEDTIKIEVDGSDLKGYRDDVEVVSATDSTITGNTRCGLYGLNGGVSGRTVIVDDFECADLSTAVTSPYYAYAQQ